MLALERRELAECPQAEVAELARICESQRPAARPGQACSRTADRPRRAGRARSGRAGHRPGAAGPSGHTAGASLLSFMAGAVLPLLAITLVPGPARIAVTIIAVLAALVAASAASAALGRAPPPGCRAQRDSRRDLRHQHADRSCGHPTAFGAAARDSGGTGLLVLSSGCPVLSYSRCPQPAWLPTREPGPSLAARAGPALSPGSSPALRPSRNRARGADGSLP